MNINNATVAENLRGNEHPHACVCVRRCVRGHGCMCDINSTTVGLFPAGEGERRCVEAPPVRPAYPGLLRGSNHPPPVHACHPCAQESAHSTTPQQPPHQVILSPFPPSDTPVTPVTRPHSAQPQGFALRCDTSDVCDAYLHGPIYGNQYAFSTLPYIYTEISVTTVTTVTHTPQPALPLHFNIRSRCHRNVTQ